MSGTSIRRRTRPPDVDTATGLRGALRRDALVLLGGLVLGLGVGTAVGIVGRPLLVLIGLAGAAFFLFAVVNLEVGLALLVFLVYTRLSDNAIVKLGVPSIAQPLVLLLLIHVMVQLRRRREVPPALRAGAIAIGPYLVVVVAGQWVATDRAATQTEVSVLLRDLLVALLVILLVRTERTWKVAIGALLVATMLLAVLSLAQHLNGSFDNDFIGLAQAADENIAGDQSAFRIGGPVADPNYFAQILLVPLPFLLVIGLTSASRRVQAAIVLASSLVLVTVILTYSRGALLALAVLLVLLVRFLRVAPRHLLVAGLLLVLSLPLLPSGYLDRVTVLTSGGGTNASGSQADESLSGRRRALEAGAAIFADNPVLGVGLGNSAGQAPAYAPSATLDTFRGGLPAHNLYVQLGAETGVLGLAAFTWAALVCLRTMARARGRAMHLAQQRLATSFWAFQAGLITYFVAALFIHAAYPRYQWFLLGLAIATANLSRSAAVEESTASGSTASGSKGSESTGSGSTTSEAARPA